MTEVVVTTGAIGRATLQIVTANKNLYICVNESVIYITNHSIFSVFACLFDVGKAVREWHAVQYHDSAKYTL